ncbi:heavy-metal-associated domain-containing protein [Streptomyces sp. NBC_00059]|uniref:heavy-metal-associated domain-containing protein n=1 Tax=Streptomyces sp. NBC_00059 TaxID=2975635 RepID=UPI002251C400|nr:cation transporter [Streptomyces sp. NBC_00059]MCX5418037.1 cation transporter [Streptomyces sp. NBC_00059]
MKWLRGMARSEGTGPHVVLKVDGMHCASCGLLVDDELEDVPGVRSARTDVRKGRSTVHLTDEGSTDPSTLIAAVERAGYQATVLV